MKTFKNKVAAVTGAASGIGRALAIELAKRGAHVAMADINAAGLAETAGMIKGDAKVTQHVIDVRDRKAVERFAAEVEAQHGGCDAIINNAGLAVVGSIEEVSYEEFEKVIDVNMWGVIYGTKSFMPLLRRRPEGHIVNISSINGMVPFANNGPYCVSKYAVLGLSETLMQELRGSTVHVTSVHPGGIRTNIVRNVPGMTDKDQANFNRLAMTSAAQAAKTILKGMLRNEERVYIGMDAKLMALAKRILPAGTVRVVGAASVLANKQRENVRSKV